MQQRQQSQSSQCQSNNPPVVLFAKARKVGGSVEWDLGFNNPPTTGKAEVDLPLDSGGHDIQIHLVATQGLQIDFDTGNPIWASEDCPCPPPEGVNTTQIDDIRCSKNKLTFFDKNEGDACTIRYQLNFVGAEPLDPVIINGGTTRS